MTAPPPLLGLRLLVTRPEGKSEGLAEILGGLGARVVVEPLTRTVALGSEEYRPLEAALFRLAEYTAVILTSGEGVRRLTTQAGRNLAELIPPAVLLVAIGPATAAACRAAGRSADILPENFNAEGLVTALEASVGIAGRRFLLVRAETGRDILPTSVSDAGGRIDVVPAYRTAADTAAAARAAKSLAAGAVDLVVAMSGAALEALAGALAEVNLAPSAVRVAALGPVTAARARQLGFTVALVAPRATVDSLIEALVAARGREE